MPLIEVTARVPVLDAAPPAPSGGTEEFYRGGGAGAIMRAAHFPDQLLSFLQLESLAALRALSRHGCDALIEHGCYDGRALEVARVAGVRYYGVDVNRAAIARLSRRIADEGLQGRAAALHGSVLRSEDWSSEVSARRPLHLLPFNLVGNLPEPGRALASLSAVGELALVSVFNDDPATTAVRLAYYTACGLAPTVSHDGRYGGVLFEGADGFRSESFSAVGLFALFNAAGATVLGIRCNRLGRCITVRIER